MPSLNIFWFRRDLRLFDNAGLFHALKEGHPVLLLFIFDTDILDELDNKQDARVTFIHDQLIKIQSRLVELGSTLLVKHGKPLEVFRQLMNEYSINHVFSNNDYEPYAIDRDKKVAELLNQSGIPFNSYKDQVIFEKKEVAKENGEPYVVFTPYYRRWSSLLVASEIRDYDTDEYKDNFYKTDPIPVPDLSAIGFFKSEKEFPTKDWESGTLANYENLRDIPSANGTSRLSVHLRFGTISIRKLVRNAMMSSETFLKELAWREFYQMILWRFPNVVTNAFKPEYDKIIWRNNPDEFEAWCNGKTGYPLVDAGMRELNTTGFMHNRVRMVVASFLVKHLLIDWRWGEAYFARQLLDYDLASNNGGWQWAAGCGCDAAPYFRIFNPYLQTKRFDPKLEYIRRWVPELDELTYPSPIVEHVIARKRCLKVFAEALRK